MWKRRHEEQVTSPKTSTLKAWEPIGRHNHWTYSDEGTTVTIAPETIVVMENLAIWILVMDQQ
jgi:hypothetical protein